MLKSPVRDGWHKADRAPGEGVLIFESAPDVQNIENNFRPPLQTELDCGGDDVTRLSAQAGPLMHQDHGSAKAADCVGVGIDASAGCRPAVPSAATGASHLRGSGVTRAGRH